MHAVTSKPDIRYAFEERPDAGGTMQVASGVHWLRMPLPFSLGHINLWILADGDSWTLVDTGVHFEDCHQVWENTFSDLMQDRPPARVLVTHLHPDHLGCAGWLTKRFTIPLWMTRPEYLLGRVLVADTGRQAPEAGHSFYKAAGFADSQLDRYHKMFGLFGKYVHELPESYRRLRDGECIAIGELEWEIVIGRGHSPAHACLYAAKQNILISGDQLLPTISSNVSVFPTEPEADPLADWLESLETLKNRVPDDVLVLPSHGKPFFGAHERLDVLIQEHHEGLDKLRDHCQQPRRVVECFAPLFSRDIDDNNLIMATGEAVAHLNYLLNTGAVQVDRDEAGVNWYRST